MRNRVRLHNKAHTDQEKAAELIHQARERAFEVVKAKIEISGGDELKKLNQEVADGKIKSEEEYQARRKQLEEKTNRELLIAEITHLKLTLALRIMNHQDAFDVLREIKQKEMELDDQVTAHKLALLQKQADAAKDAATGDLELSQQLADKKKELATELQNVFVSIIQGQFDKQKNAIQEQINLNDEKTRREIEGINASNLSAQDKANRIAILDKTNAARKLELERRQRQVDIERARFDRLVAIANVVQHTAQGITAALATIPPNVPLSIVIGAIGAAQIAAIVARPIPKFKHGTDKAPKGPAVYGEAGRELVIEKSGKVYLTPSVPTITNLKGDEKIFPHDVTEKIIRYVTTGPSLRELAAINNISTSSTTSTTNVTNNILNSINPLRMIKSANEKQVIIIHDPMARDQNNGEMINVLKRIERKSGVNVNVINNIPIESTAYYQFHIKR